MTLPMNMLNAYGALARAAISETATIPPEPFITGNAILGLKRFFI